MGWHLNAFHNVVRMGPEDGHHAAARSADRGTGGRIAHAQPPALQVRDGAARGTPPAMDGVGRRADKSRNCWVFPLCTWPKTVPRRLRGLRLLGLPSRSRTRSVTSSVPFITGMRQPFSPGNLRGRPRWGSAIRPVIRAACGEGWKSASSTMAPRRMPMRYFSWIGRADRSGP